MSKVKGIAEITKKINKAIGNMKHTSSRGLASAAVYIANKAVQRAPIEDGDLKNSVYIDLDGKRVAKGEEEVRNAQNRVGTDIGINEKMGTVGFCSKYAVKQHEDLSLRHDRTDGYRVPEFNQRTGKPNKTAGKSINRIPGGQAKFLESVLVEEQDRILRCIANEVELGDGND